MLPRLVVVAIAINLSYFIVSIAVDLFNLLGSSLKDLIDSESARLGKRRRLTGGASRADSWGYWVYGRVGGGVCTVRGVPQCSSCFFRPPLWDWIGRGVGDFDAAKQLFRY